MSVSIPKRGSEGCGSSSSIMTCFASSKLQNQECMPIVGTRRDAHARTFSGQAVGGVHAAQAAEQKSVQAMCGLRSGHRLCRCLPAARPKASRQICRPALEAQAERRTSHRQADCFACSTLDSQQQSHLRSRCRVLDVCVQQMRLSRHPPGQTFGASGWSCRDDFRRYRITQPKASSP